MGRRPPRCVARPTAHRQSVVRVATLAPAHDGRRSQVIVMLTPPRATGVRMASPSLSNASQRDFHVDGRGRRNGADVAVAVIVSGSSFRSSGPQGRASRPPQGSAIVGGPSLLSPRCIVSCHDRNAFTQRVDEGGARSPSGNVMLLVVLPTCYAADRPQAACCSACQVVVSNDWSGLS